MAKVCIAAVANSSKVPSSIQALIHAMDFAYVELFSVTHLGSYLARKCETQQTCKQAVKQLPRRQRFTHHAIIITFFESVYEANGACLGLKENHDFNRRLGSILYYFHCRLAQAFGEKGKRVQPFGRHI